MTFSAGGLIDTNSYNYLASLGVVIGTGININLMYNTGKGIYGFGQPNPLPLVTNADKVTSAQWTTALSRITQMANHVGVSQNPMDPTAVNDLIKYDIDYIDNLEVLNRNMFSAAAQGTPTSLTGTCTNSWKQQCYFDHTITFPTADSARYFFNMGGQIKLTYASPTGPSYKIDYLINQLASSMGTVVMSAPAMSEYLPNGVKIAGTMFQGITLLAGLIPESLNERLGYYGLRSSALVNFNSPSTLAVLQRARVGLSPYLDTNLQVRVMSNGPQGANQDNGNIIYIRSLFDEVPNGGAGDTTVTPGTTATCTLVPPSTTYLAKTWGNPTMTVNVVAV